MSTTTRYATGYSTTTPTDPVLTWHPKGYIAGSKSGVLLLHGGTVQPAVYRDGKNDPHLSSIAQAIGDAGFPIVAPNCGGDLVTNAAAIAYTNEAYNYLTGAMGAKSGKVHVVGHSMGGALAMAWARQNIAKVASLLLFQPLSDIQDAVTNNRGGYAAMLNAAYSGGYSNAVYGAVSNPAVFAADLAGIPTQVWYTTDDVVVIPSSVAGVLSKIGSSATVGGTGTGGHSDPGLAFTDTPTNRAAMTAFLAAH